jgi:hypothetical protein
METVYAKATNKVILDYLKATGGPLETCKVKLIKQTIALTPETAVADLDAIEADFVGYAAVAITWGTSYFDAEDQGRVQSQNIVWVMTDATKPQQIFGYYVTSSDGATLYYSALFDAPVNLATAGQGFNQQVGNGFAPGYAGTVDA